MVIEPDTNRNFVNNGTLMAYYYFVIIILLIIYICIYVKWMDMIMKSSP